MNKRKAKKARKKIYYPLVDEMNLPTLSPEEYKDAMRDFHEWVQKHCRYKHYKDKYKNSGFSCYHFPVGEQYKKQMEAYLKRVRKRNVQVVIQDNQAYLSDSVEGIACFLEEKKG